MNGNPLLGGPADLSVTMMEPVEGWFDKIEHDVVALKDFTLLPDLN